MTILLCLIACVLLSYRFPCACWYERFLCPFSQTLIGQQQVLRFATDVECGSEEHREIQAAARVRQGPFHNHTLVACLIDCSPCVCTEACNRGLNRHFLLLTRASASCGRACFQCCCSPTLASCTPSND